VKEVQLLFDLYDDRKLAKIKTRFPILERDIVLDAGCGPGYRTLEAASICFAVVAVDHSKFCLGELERKLHAVPHYGPRTHVVLADIQHLPFRDGSFTKVICTDALEHVDHDRIAVKEFKRTLITNGLLYVAVPARGAEEFLCHLDRTQLWRRGHVRTYDLEALPALLRSEGFQVFCTERSGFFRALYHLAQILLGVTIERETGAPLRSRKANTFFFRVWRVAKPLYRSRIGMAIDKSGASLLARALEIYAKKIG
jgi:SAM-dependent methyltransferase